MALLFSEHISTIKKSLIKMYDIQSKNSILQIIIILLYLEINIQYKFIQYLYYLQFEIKIYI